MEEGEGMKKVFGALAFLSFFVALGTVGAIEQDMVSLGTGFLRAAIALGCMWLFGWLAGGFDPPDYADDQKKSRPREQHSHRRQA